MKILKLIKRKKWEKKEELWLKVEVIEEDINCLYFFLVLKRVYFIFYIWKDILNFCIEKYNLFFFKK